MATPLQKQEFATFDSTRYVSVNVLTKAQGESLSENYEVYFDLELVVDMSVIQWDEKPAFWEFINGSYHSHLAVVYTTLQSSPELLHIELKSGYLSYVASRHTFNLPTEEIEVALVSEMRECKGMQAIWRTTVMTVLELNEWVESNKVLPN